MHAAQIEAPPHEPERLVLGTQRWVRFRPVERSDRDALVAFYAGLSPEARRRRFLSAGAAPDVGAMADADGIVGLLREPGPRDGAVVAHASIQPDGTGGAELAFAVADDLQGRGIGRSLVRLALDRARDLGLRRAEAVLLADNTPMRHLLRRAGAAVQADVLDAGVEEITLDLAD